MTLALAFLLPLTVALLIAVVAMATRYPGVIKYKVPGFGIEIDGSSIPPSEPKLLDKK